MKAIVGASVIVALTVVQAWAGDGWSRRDKVTGTVFYDCVSDTCTTGSMISCHMQRANAFETMDQYERWRGRRTDQIRASGAEVDAGRAARSAVGPWMLYQDEYVSIDRGGDGRTLRYRSGFLVGETQSISIVSSSTSAVAANRNFIDFVGHIAALPLASSRESCTPAKTSNREADKGGRTRRTR